MEDIAPQLLEAIQKDFAEILGDAKLKELNYMGAEKYAETVGEALVQAFRKNLSADKLPEGKMFWNIADRVVRPMLEEDHRLVADAAQQVQQALNKAAGLGLKAQRANLDEDKVSGILNKVAAADDFDSVAWVLDEPVKTFLLEAVDETLRRNVEFQGKAGLQPKVIRKAERRCCKWCRGLGGVYEYPEVPKDVYRRHERCRCNLEYDPGTGKQKTLWAAGDTAQKRAIEKRQKESAERRKEKIKKLEQTDLNKMSLPQLRKLAKETAMEYYKSGLSGISFGGHDIEKAAESLANQGSRTSLKKDIRSMRKKMADGIGFDDSYGIIKTRTTSDTEYKRRRIGGQGQEIIDQPTYHKLTKDFVKNGGKIIRGEDAEKHLIKQGAYASYLPSLNAAFIRDDATVSDVLEEMYHAKQDRSNRFGAVLTDEVFLRREIEAQQYLLQCSSKYKIPKEETEVTIQNLKKYEAQLEKLMKERSKV